jgi:hypothetical protein
VGGCILAAAAGLESARSCSGFVKVGGSSGTVLLARAAAADLYPPASARGISYVLFGSLGRGPGPLVFRRFSRAPPRLRATS